MRGQQLTTSGARFMLTYARVDPQAEYISIKMLKDGRSLQMANVHSPNKDQTNKLQPTKYPHS